MTLHGDGLDFAAMRACYDWMSLDDVLDALEIADWRASWQKAMEARAAAQRAQPG